MKPTVEPSSPNSCSSLATAKALRGATGTALSTVSVAAGRRVKWNGPGILATGDGEERAHGGPAREPARDLPRSENRRLIGRDHAVGHGPSRGRGPDAARVEVARTQPLHELAPFGEEGAALLEHLLERGQVHDRGVRLDLSEVRVDGGVEREARTEADLEIRSHAGLAPGHDAHHGAARGSAQVARHVGQKLDPAAPPHALESGEVAEARGPSRARSERRVPTGGSPGRRACSG